MKEFPVVVADDDASMLRLLKARLTRAGFKVFTCADGDAALILVQRHKPVILLVDWEMPGLTGPELCQHIRNSKLGEEVYAILLTGNSRPDQIASGLDRGADDYLVKPVHPTVLLARVQAGERSLRFRVRQGEYARKLESEILKRKNAEAELRKLSVAVEQSPASIIITDTQGTIEYVNPMFCEVTGYAAEEVIGQNPRILKSSNRPMKATKRLWDTILASKVWTGAFENRKKNGELYWEEASLCPIRDAAGTITHFLAVKQDITERKKVEESLRKTESELRQHRDHLEELVGERTAELAKINDSLAREIFDRWEAEKAATAAGRAKGDFLATMSHELRTPLNGIIGMTELLLGSGLTREQKRQAGLVKASGDILLRLINDILDFSKIEAGKLELEITDFDLRESIECVAALLGPQAVEKGLELTVGVNPAVPAAVRGDPGRFQQILTNLVSNAIKFTEHGQIVIRAAVDDENESSVSVRISVTDTGIGIPAGKQDSLFQSFSQLDASHSRRFGGTGLGLAISKQLVELMGGEIGAISEPGRGSTFWFVVALEKG